MLRKKVVRRKCLRSTPALVIKLETFNKTWSLLCSIISTKVFDQSNSAVHSASSSEEEIEDSDSDIDFGAIRLSTFLVAMKRTRTMLTMEMLATTVRMMEARARTLLIEVLTVTMITVTMPRMRILWTKVQLNMMMPINVERADGEWRLEIFSLN